MSKYLAVKNLGTVPYIETWQQMKRFTDDRTDATRDELWLLEHPSVYTLGQAGKEEHVLAPGDIPIVKSDRGGQVTYHGPGQLVGYLLLDIRRLGLGVRDLVDTIERCVIRLLSDNGIAALARREAPGVYVDGRKVAALGLRVRKGRSYHGLSLNVDMDLSPFSGINPCGYEGLEVIDLKGLGINLSVAEAGAALTDIVISEFGYNERE